MSARPPSFDDVNSAALAAYPRLLKSWFPNGYIEDGWFHAAGWRGDPLKTVHVNLKTGRWHVTERRWVSTEPEAAQ